MKKECATCGGTGQVGYFQGVSRFLLTWDECPQCFGTGFVDQDVPQQQSDEKKASGKKLRQRKKKKS